MFNMIFILTEAVTVAVIAAIIAVIAAIIGLLVAAVKIFGKGASAVSSKFNIFITDFILFFVYTISDFRTYFKFCFTVGNISLSMQDLITYLLVAAVKIFGKGASAVSSKIDTNNAKKLDKLDNSKNNTIIKFSSIFIIMTYKCLFNIFITDFILFFVYTISDFRTYFTR